MQNVNFFSWIRDGVKQSVLLGVSDAIETIGSPDDRGQLHPDVAALLNDSGNSEAQPRINKRAGTAGTAASRKRLGRSLKDIEPQT